MIIGMAEKILGIGDVEKPYLEYKNGDSDYFALTNPFANQSALLDGKDGLPGEGPDARGKVGRCFVIAKQV